MKKFYVSPLVSEFETGVESGFCTSGVGSNKVDFSSNTWTSGYYEEEN